MKKLPVVGYEGYYEVSECGEIFSIPRIVTGTDGVDYPFPAVKLKQVANKNVRYMAAGLWRNNKGTTVYVHRVVAEAFIPNPMKKAEVNHLDGDRQNNAVSNLEWVTRKENLTHAIATGLRTYSNRLSEEEFLECLQDIVAGESYLSLSKRVPYKVPFLSVKLRKIAKKYGIEDLLNSSLQQQKLERARRNGYKNRRTNRGC